MAPLPVVAGERARRARGRVVTRTGEPIVDEQRDAAFERRRHGPDPGAKRRTKLALVALSKRRAALSLELTDRLGEQGIGGTRDPREASLLAPDAERHDARGGAAEALDGQRIQDLVREHETRERLRRHALEPLDAPAERGR